MNPEESTVHQSQESSTIDPSKFETATHTLNQILDEMAKVVVGQDQMNRSLLIGLVTGGHILLEGLPGLAKTLTVRTLAQIVRTRFQRIQFTPDLLPTDLIGTMIYNDKTKEFVPKKGPIFANIVLADEINRAPAKVQSALLEAMAEKQVTIGETTHPLPEPFLVMATQNPIEQEGTYNLPEAQLDRFMYKVKVGYPNRNEERIILERMASFTPPETTAQVSTEAILAIRNLLPDIYLDERIKDYILRIVLSTRKEESIGAEEANLEKLQNIRKHIAIGASPRATLFLSLAARANALFEQRHYVTPDDIKGVAKEVLRHRLIPTFEAEAKNISTDDILSELLETVFVP